MIKYIKNILFFSVLVFGCDSKSTSEIASKSTNNNTFIYNQTHNLKEYNQKWRNQQIIRGLISQPKELGKLISIPNKNVSSIDLYILNLPILTPIAMEFDNLKIKEIYQDDQSYSHSRNNKEVSVHYQVVPEQFNDALNIISNMKTFSFKEPISAEKKFSKYYHYRLLLEIKYKNKQEIILLTTNYIPNDILFAKVNDVNNSKKYFVLDNRDMDKLVHYLDPEMVTFAFFR